MCFFAFVFSLAKKKFVSFTQHTDIKYQIPHHHSFVARKKTHTYIYLLLSYINEFRGAQIGVTTHRRGRVRVVLFHPPRILIINDFKEAFENDENDENDDENVIVASGNRLTIYSVKRRRRKERGEECDDEEEKEDLNEDEEIVAFD